MAFNTYYPMAYYGQQQFYQPQAQPLQMPSQTTAPAAMQTGILWVGSEQEAQAYPLAPNNAVALWDSTRQTVYLKQSDASGKPTLKTYDLTERTEAVKSAASSATGNDAAIADIRREIKDLWASFEDLRSDFRAGRRPARKKEVVEDDAE